MGDVDFYVAEKDIESGRKILQENGYQGDPMIGDHDWSFHRNSIHYELHFAISGVPKGKEGDPFRAELENLIAQRRWIDKKRMGRIAIPSDYHHGLIIFLHTASHLMCGGLGLRQLCDWAALVNHFSEDEFQRIF